MWLIIMRGFQHVEKDIPLALLYSVTSYQASENDPNQQIPAACKLEGTVGISEGHILAPKNVQVESDKGWLSELFWKATKNKEPLYAAVPEELEDAVKGINSTKPGIPASSIVVCPVQPTNSARTMAFLVVALSPVRPYNEDYQRFIHLLIEQVATPHMSALLLQEEVERRLQAAEQEAIDRARLSRELFDVGTKFSLFEARAPIGLAILTEAGRALSANNLWRELTMLEVGSDTVEWEKVLVDGEFEHVSINWDQMISNKKSIRLQTATKRPWQAPEPDEHGNPQWTDTYLLLALYPDMEDDGSLKSVMSCITDITELKWTEAQLRTRMNQAIKMQQQQEKFIDVSLISTISQPS